ncbi:hypothetical protein [Ottowia sp.]|uniref:hypothetical protein n=1 Tax=Ottowia sp. TaxID=1898956 RepID=UPI0025E84A6F|nr:hypothetical protein [Ottowia sp.]MBK6616553.1 hypothetical protein [Ottowia sp.]
MAIRVDQIKVGACFTFKVATRRVTGLSGQTARGFNVHWEYADGKKRGGRLSGEQWCHYFAKEALQEVPSEDEGTRTLLSGRVVVSKKDITAVSIRTHCVAKWAFVDLETGDTWAHDGSGLVRASEHVQADLKAALQRRSV